MSNNRYIFRNAVTNTAHKKFTKLNKVNRGDNSMLGIPSKTTLKNVLLVKQLDIMNMYLLTHKKSARGNKDPQGFVVSSYKCCGVT